MKSVGMAMVVFGGVLVAAGIWLLVVGKWPRLPGDFVFRGERATVYIPLASCLLLSLVLTLLLNLVFRR